MTARERNYRLAEVIRAYLRRKAVSQVPVPSAQATATAPAPVERRNIITEHERWCEQERVRRIAVAKRPLRTVDVIMMGSLPQGGWR